MDIYTNCNYATNFGSISDFLIIYQKEMKKEEKKSEWYDVLDFNSRMKDVELNVCFAIVLISMLTALSVLYSNL